MDALGLQVSKFAMVGVLNTLIDLVLFNIIRKFGKVKPVVASYISSTFAMLNSYVLNKYWTFSSQSSTDGVSEAVRFFGTTIIGVYGIHNGLVWVFTEKFTWPANLAYSITSKLPILKKLSKEFVRDNIGKVMGIFGSLAWNFVLYKFWVFK